LRDLESLIRDLSPDVISVSHSYLAPRVRPLVPEGTTFLVDFANVEHHRLKSLSGHGRLRNRISAKWESSKAASWEPQAARDADVCVAVDDRDQRTLLSWGARRTCIVPNSVDELPPYTPSPAIGPALFLGSGSYAPNVAGGRWLLAAVWPEVRRRHPTAELWIAGRGTESTFRAIPALGVRVLGGVDDLSALVTSSAICVVPVSSGAGTQLKVLDALARHRTVVTTRFSSRSLPESAIDNCYIEDSSTGFADAIVKALIDVRGRQARETMVARHVPVWTESVQPLSELLHEHVSPPSRLKVTG
jgi:hypothetical protein